MFKQLQRFAATRGLHYQSDVQQTGEQDAYVFSADMAYRYAFARRWRSDGPLVLWVGVNPAKGDTEKRRRPTLERCVRWSKSCGAGGLLIGNLFAARHNMPKGLRETADPIGPNNDDALRLLSTMATETVVAWGNAGRRHGCPDALAVLLRDPKCFGLTKKGQPRHPLYVPEDTPLEP
jgi:hypothetical protein